MEDELNIRRRRVRWRAKHRGTKEMDVLLGRYADSAVDEMSGAALDEFEQFVALADPELQRWLLDGVSAKGSQFADLVGKVRLFHGLSAGGQDDNNEIETRS